MLNGDPYGIEAHTILDIFKGASSVMDVCFSIPMKGLVLQKYFPIFICIFVGFYILLYGSMFGNYTVCVIKKEVGPNTYEIEDPDLVKVQQPGFERVRRANTRKEKHHHHHEDVQQFQEAEMYLEDPVVGYDSTAEDDLEMYPDSTLEKYGLTDADCNCSGRYKTSVVRVKYLCMNQGRHQPLVTMFTTMGDDPGRVNVHSNTIRTWSKLERVRSILFVTCSMIDSGPVTEACREGWDVALVPSCDTTHELPVLRTMFLAAQKISDSAFYGYANADMLFTESLVKTLEFLEFQIERSTAFQKNLIVGGRINLKINSSLRIDTMEEIEQLSAVGEPALVTYIDYFISSKKGYPWETIPPLVVGRRAFDNWLVLNARKILKISTFDATDTILAAHQGGPDISWVPHMEREGADINTKLIGGKVNLLDGVISCTKFKIMPDDKTGFALYWRKKPGFCGSGSWPKRAKWQEIIKKDGFRKIKLRK